MIPFVDTLKISLQAIVNHRSRAFLTMLGLIIGVGSVTLLVALGNGVRTFVVREFESLGSNLIIIQPGKADGEQHFGPPMGLSEHRMTIEDVKALERRATSIDAVSGVVLGNASAEYEEYQRDVTVFGTNEQFLKILALKVGDGSYFTREEDDFGRRVVILGSKVIDKLFGADPALGKMVTINSHRFKIIGILAPTGHKVGLDIDTIAFIPTRSALRLFNNDRLFGIRARAKTRNSVSEATEEIRSILRERHDDKEDFSIMTQGALMESISTILTMLTYVIGSIAAISMLVAGIGIMNIMLVSVTERIAEIGIRRAVGATRTDIVVQFLVEAMVLSVSGGGLGAILASAVGAGVSWYYPRFNLVPPTWVVIPAFLISLAIGVIFGVLPSIRAARIEPLDALRHE